MPSSILFRLWITFTDMPFRQKWPTIRRSRSQLGWSRCRGTRLLWMERLLRMWPTLSGFRLRMNMSNRHHARPNFQMSSGYSVRSRLLVAQSKPAVGAGLQGGPARKGTPRTEFQQPIQSAPSVLHAQNLPASRTALCIAGTRTEIAVLQRPIHATRARARLCRHQRENCENSHPETGRISPSSPTRLPAT